MSGGRPLLAIDGDSLAHRAFHGVPASIKGSDGAPANMLHGFAQMLISLCERERPRTLFVGFDTLTSPTYRHELLPGYQSGREFGPDLLRQLDLLPQWVEAFGFTFGKEAGYEADDFVAAAASSEEERGGTTLVVTSDRDLFQLATERTTLILPRKGVSEVERVGPAEVRERYGVDPEQVPDFIALRGDTADKIPGAKGIGAVRAAAILNAHGTLDAAIEDGVFDAQAEQLRTYLRITRLQYQAPVPQLPDAEPDFAGAARLSESWGLGAVSRRLLELA